jgi:hypothetical protein
MVRGIGRMASLIGLAAGALAVPYGALLIEIEAERRQRREYNAHVWDWERHQRGVRLERERLAKLARARPQMEAAEEKRARKNARRAALSAQKDAGGPDA